jgi:hypothetical protein
MTASSCRDVIFEVAQKWNGNDIIERDGTTVDSVSDASVHTGQRWPFVGSVSDRPAGWKKKNGKGTPDVA